MEVIMSEYNDEWVLKKTRWLRRVWGPKFSGLPQRMRFGRFRNVYGLVRLCRECVGVGSRGLEVGSFAGESAVIFVQVARPRELVCVDPWDELAVRASYTERLAGARECFLDTAAKLPGVRPVRARSDVALPELESGSFDWVYIDGGHLEDEVARDIGLALPLVRPGGVLMGHDYGRSLHPGVTVAVDRLLGKPWRVYEDSSWVVRC
jgi:SAM-dependent methyltransferase